ncbi:MAG: hypothetical protein ACREVG_04775 [Burkholderiales bacterium]
MSRIVRVLAFILGTSWFFPVSCTTGVIVGVPVVAHFHERHMEKGDQPHSLFTVVWQPGEAGEPFGYSRLADLARNKTPAPARSFIMTQPSGRSEGARFNVVTYKVLSSGASEQLIEVTWADDDYGSVSRYRATPSGVTPVFSKIMDPGYMFIAFLPALAFAAAIYAVGVRLRRRIARAKTQGDASSRIDSSS